jgi:hypothetical protein
MELFTKALVIPVPSTGNSPDDIHFRERVIGVPLSVIEIPWHVIDCGAGLRNLSGSVIVLPGSVS